MSRLKHKTAIRIALILAFTAPVSSALAQGDAVAGPTSLSSDQSLIGDWHGTSVCLVKPSACHDEEALYHVTALAGRPGRFSVQGDKIVDGKPVVMGTMECSYDVQQKLLHCEFERGSIDLTLTGNQLHGHMFLKDKTPWRKIDLTRS